MTRGYELSVMCSATIRMSIEVASASEEGAKETFIAALKDYANFPEGAWCIELVEPPILGQDFTAKDVELEPLPARRR